MVWQQNGTACLLQDVKNLFIYWDFSPERMRILRDFMEFIKPDMRFCLRLMGYDQSSYPGNPSVEREVVFDRLDGYGCYYFYGINPSLDYRFEFGGKDSGGNFVLFSRSALIELQPPRPSAESRVIEPPALDWELIAGRSLSSSYYVHERS